MRTMTIALLATALAAAGCSPFQTARMGTGLISNTLCTAAFVTNVDPDRIYKEAVYPESVMSWVDWGMHYEVDREHQTVRATFLGGFEESSTHKDGAGCQSQTPGLPPVATTGDVTSLRVVVTPSLAPIAGPEVVTAADPKLRAMVESMFAVTPSGDGPRTKAVVVVYKGRVIAERYGEGYSMTSKLPGYSDTKSVISALIGVLVRQGKLAVNDPVPAWSQPGDPRRAVTVDYLVRMRSGLDWDESVQGGPDDMARAWFLEADKAALPLSKPLAKPAGSKWAYNSGNTLVLSRIIRDAVGGTQADVQRFMRQELFGPLGMDNVEFEFDRTGTPMGGAGMSATARDWARFGVLYAQDGMAGSKRILPEGWAAYSAAPGPAEDAWVGYGAGFWTNLGDSFGAKRRRDWGAPVGSFFASGHLGQIVLIVPEQDLVIVRFGWSHGPYGGFEEMFGQFGAIAAAVKARVVAER